MAASPPPPAPSAPVARDAARSRRARNIAIGLAVTGFAVLIYAITIVKLGPQFLKQL